MTTPPGPDDAPQDPWQVGGQPAAQPPSYGEQPPPGYGQPPAYGQPPPGYGQPPYGQPVAQNSNTPMILGIVGIVLAVCCWPAGLALGITSYVQAQKQPGGNTVLGIIAIVLSVLNGIVSIVMVSTGNGFVYYNR